MASRESSRSLNSFASIIKKKINEYSVQLQQRENYYYDGSTLRFCFAHIDYTEADLLPGGFSQFPKGKLPNRSQFMKTRESTNKTETTSSNSAATTIAKPGVSKKSVLPLSIDQPTNKPSAIPDWSLENELRSCSSYTASYTRKQHQIDIDKRLALKRPAVSESKAQPAAKRTKIVRPYWSVDDGLHRDWDYSAEYTKEQHQLDIDERLAAYEQQGKQRKRQSSSSSSASSNSRTQHKKQDSDEGKKVVQPSSSPENPLSDEEESEESEDDQREDQSEKFNTLVTKRYLAVVADHHKLFTGAGAERLTLTRRLLRITIHQYKRSYHLTKLNTASPFLHQNS